jgi:FdrA protein
MSTGGLPRIRVISNRFVDSVVQMAMTRAMLDVDGVRWAAAAMGTPANIAQLHDRGFTDDEVTGISAGDLFLAVEADDQRLEEALEAGMSAAQSERGSGGAQQGSAEPTSLDAALEVEPGLNVAVISLPGEYAALEAHKALSRGMDVLLFSDGVSVEAEIRLKDHAAEVGRLLMGPGAGTAMLGRTGLGFANAVPPGPVGVIAAAGTGAQEVSVLLDRWGVGTSHIIGLGGRDLSDAVGGRMAALALSKLDADPDTKVVLLVSKPPSVDVARRLLSRPRSTPVIAALVGWPQDAPAMEGVRIADTLEGGAMLVLEELSLGRPDRDVRWGPPIDEVCRRMPERRTAVRGLFSGGTLCYESLVLLGRVLGPVHSNTPLDKHLGLPAPAGAHVCLDLGEEEYTRGRPHPMIDPGVRLEILGDVGHEEHVAAVILDVVLGHGSHPDPAGALAPVAAALMEHDGPQVVAYVLGTQADPQEYEKQVRSLTDAGCIVTTTAARASMTAAAIARRDPALASADPR